MECNALLKGVLLSMSQDTGEGDERLTLFPARLSLPCPKSDSKLSGTKNMRTGIPTLKQVDNQNSEKKSWNCLVDPKLEA